MTLVNEVPGYTPKLQRQFDWLAHWLAQPSLTPYQLACLFIGVLPNEHHTRGFGGYLPAVEPWPSREAWEWRVKRDITELEQRIVTLSGIGFMASARALIAVANAGKKLPPWLDAAREHDGCRAELPPAWLEEQEPKHKRDRDSRQSRTMKKEGKEIFVEEILPRLSKYQKPSGNYNIKAIACDVGKNMKRRKKIIDPQTGNIRRIGESDLLKPRAAANHVVKWLQERGLK